MKKSYLKLNIIFPLTIMFVTLSALPVSVKASDITNENIVYLVNKERTDYGVAPLREDTDLDLAALVKSSDMINRNYFEHYAYGLTPWDFMLSYNYNYLFAGENLAMNFQTAEGVVNAWMKSPSHRANILNPDYQDLGIGVITGDFTTSNGTHQTKMVTELLGRRKSVITNTFDSIFSTFRIFSR